MRRAGPSPARGVALALRENGSEVGAAPLVLASALASAAFGAAVGSYVGGLQIVYAAVKMPVFFLGTLAICLAIFAALAAPHLPPGAAVRVAVRGIFTTTMILGALSPPILLAGLSLPKPHAYAHMVLLLTLAIAAAGTWSVVRLRRLLPGRGLLAAWVAIYGLVGAQMAWLLKPWVGYTMVADRFIPLSDNLRGNFYEAVWRSLTIVLEGR